MKRRLLALLILVVLAITTVCGCQSEKKPDTTAKKQEGLPDAPEGAISSEGDNKILSAGDYRVEFIKGDDGYAVNVVAASTKDVLFAQDQMAEVKVRGEGKGIGVVTYDEVHYSAPYSSVIEEKYGYLAEATVTTESGSKFSVKDSWYVVNDEVYGMERIVEVTEKGSEDVGFASIVTMTNAEGATKHDAYDYFIPAILYKDSEAVVEGAIASNLALDYLYVKETRTGLPMVMARSKQTGYSLALMHLNPNITVEGTVGGGNKGEVNDKLQYGAVGLLIEPEVSVSFVYPCTEAPNTYDSGAGTISRYHSVEVGTTHTYRVGLIPEKNERYSDAMIASYKSAYLAEERYVADVDMEEIMEQNMEIFQGEYREFSFRKELTAAGLPWSLTLPDASVDQGYSFQMGFVGQQLPLGYQMYRYGLMNDDSKLQEKGINIVNTWTKKAIQGTYFPVVWWDPTNSASGGSPRNYPCFLRCMVDGMEGMLDAYRVAEAYGEESQHQEWYNVVYKFATNLVAVQNEDGSFYRAYNKDGSVCTDSSNSTFQGTSKLNTPIAIRFLARMYEYTGEERFKTAALKASEFCYNELYMGLEKYVGGTPDNPNTVDKEAAVYAMYGFLCAYQLSGDEKYMNAAEHAAVSTMSWVYTYDFAVPNSKKEDEAINPFAEGGVIGFSLIATGHSGADNYIAYTYFDMFKMYVLTGDEFYHHASLLLENDTKLSTDYEGELGYKYKAMMPEATTVSDFSFRTVGTWLPWSGVANVEPISKMEDAFGDMNIENLKLDIDTLLTQLNEYGCGGKPIRN